MRHPHTLSIRIKVATPHLVRENLQTSYPARTQGARYHVRGSVPQTYTLGNAGQMRVFLPSGAAICPYGGLNPGREGATRNAWPAKQKK